MSPYMTYVRLGIGQPLAIEPEDFGYEIRAALNIACLQIFNAFKNISQLL